MPEVTSGLFPLEMHLNTKAFSIETRGISFRLHYRQIFN